MSMLSNLFHKKNTTSSVPQQSSLVSNPVLTNASQMNNEFLNHHKHFNQQGSLVQQPMFSQAPIISQAPITTLPMSSWNQSSLQSGSTYRRGGPYRQFRLRTNNWGSRSENGWSGFNNWKYQPQNLASWEPKNYILEELRAQAVQSRGLNLQQQPTMIQQAPVVAQQPILFKGKQSRGHHHGLRKKRAQAVLPVQPIGGGPAIATIAPAPMFAPLFAAPLVAPIVAPIVAPVAPLHETVVMPTIVQETVRTDRVIEVQPVLHRQIEQPIVNHIERHITEAPAPLLGGTVRMQPIVQETLNTRVVDEVQPVIHREVAIAQVERVEEHLVERVVAPTQHTNSIVNEASLVAPLSAPITSSPALTSAPLVNSTPITKVVPNFAAAPSPILLEKQQQASLVQPVSSTYGSAMM